MIHVIDYLNHAVIVWVANLSFLNRKTFFSTSLSLEMFKTNLCIFSPLFLPTEIPSVVFYKPSGNSGNIWLIKSTRIVLRLIFHIQKTLFIEEFGGLLVMRNALILLRKHTLGHITYSGCHMQSWTTCWQVKRVLGHQSSWCSWKELRFSF